MTLLKLTDFEIELDEVIKEIKKEIKSKILCELEESIEKEVQSQVTIAIESENGMFLMDKVDGLLDWKREIEQGWIDITKPFRENNKEGKNAR